MLVSYRVQILLGTVLLQDDCCLQDKILQSMGRTNDIMVTNDGATILKALYVDNPAAKVLVGNACPEDMLVLGSCLIRCL